MFSVLTALFPLGSWAESRPNHAVVVFVPGVMCPGLGSALRAAGCRLQAAQSLGGGLAMLLSCPPAVAAELLTLPRPVSRGSRTASNKLNW